MSPSRPETDAELQVYGSRGLWVPKGMTAGDIMIGTEVLEQRFGVEHYTARSMVRAVLEALRNRAPEARAGMGPTG